jgi:hypothetical protein
LVAFLAAFLVFLAAFFFVAMCVTSFHHCRSTSCPYM